MPDVEEFLAIATIELGLSVEDFYHLTPYEFSVLLDRHQQHLIASSELSRNVFLNALLNSKRQKGQRFIDLFKKSGTTKRKKPERTPEEIKRERDLIFN